MNVSDNNANNNFDSSIVIRGANNNRQSINFNVQNNHFNINPLGAGEHNQTLNNNTLL